MWSLNVSRVIKLAPIFVLIGTVGLLINEFILNWGRTATLIFSAISLLGFTLMGMWMLQKNAVQDGDNL
jgi:hypothetical protein